MDDQQTVMVLVIDPPEGWRFGFPKIVPAWLKPENLDAWVVQQGYPRIMRDAGCRELTLRLWYKEVPQSELPPDYYEENDTHGEF